MNLEEVYKKRTCTSIPSSISDLVDFFEMEFHGLIFLAILWVISKVETDDFRKFVGC